eukprot:Opistho-2@35816
MASEAGIAPTIELFGAAVTQIMMDDSENSLRVALQVLGEMTVAGIEPDLRVHGEILHYLMRNRMHEECVSLFQEVLQSNPTLDVATGTNFFTAMIKVASRISDFEVADRAIGEAVRLAGTTPLPASVWDVFFLSGVTEQLPYPRLIKRYGEMIDSGIVPSEQVFRLVLQRVADFGDGPAALRIVADMKAGSIVPEKLGMQYIFEASCQAPKPLAGYEKGHRQMQILALEHALDLYNKTLKDRISLSLQASSRDSVRSTSRSVRGGS